MLIAVMDSVLESVPVGVILVCSEHFIKWECWFCDSCSAIIGNRDTQFSYVIERSLLGLPISHLIG